MRHRWLGKLSSVQHERCDVKITKTRMLIEQFVLDFPPKADAPLAQGIRISDLSRIQELGFGILL